MKDIESHVQKAQQVSSRMNKKQATFRLITVTLQKKNNITIKGKKD